MRPALVAVVLAACSAEPQPPRWPVDSLVRESGAPQLVGDGTLARVDFGGVGQANDFVVSRDERHVVVEVPHQPLHTLDTDLRVAGRSFEAFGRVGFAPDGRGLFLEGRDLALRAMPSLREIERASCPADASLTSVWDICPLPGGTEFVIVAWGEVQRFQLDPLRWGSRAHPKLRRPIAGAIDPQTGLLVMVGDGTRLEVYDPVAMKSVATVALPFEVGFDVVAVDGRAWVATNAGVILPVNLASRAVGDPVRLGPKGDVRLALSASGRTLAAAVEARTDPTHYPTSLWVFRVEKAALAAVAGARFVNPAAAFGISVIESRQAVLLAGSRPLVWRWVSPRGA